MPFPIRAIASFVGEKYFTGICLGFGVATAQVFLKWGYTVRNSLSQINWQEARHKAQEEIKTNPDKLWNWRK